MKHNPFSGDDTRNTLFIIAVFIVVVLFARCYTLYPVDDDWSYIRAVETFYTTGTLSFTPWTSPSLVFQVLWGGLFCLLFGFSVNTLVLSTQVISLAGFLAAYRLLRATGCTARNALWLTLLLIFNPFWFPLMHTFFTDHFYLALMIGASWFYYQGFTKKKSSTILLGSLITSCAVLERQPGLLIAVAAALYCITDRERRKYIAPVLVLPVITFCLYTWWFRYVHGETYSSRQQIQWIVDCLSNPVYLISKLATRPLLILELFGFSLLPLSLALLPSPRDLFTKRQTPLITVFVLSGVLFYLIEDHLGIYAMLYNWINGFHFAYVSEYGYRGAGSMLLLFYKLLDFLSIFSITHIVWHALTGRRLIRRALSSPRLLLALIALVQLLFLMVVRYKFSRYYIPLLPYAVILVYPALHDRALKKYYFVPLLVCFALFSFAGTQDFLAWNEAKWKLGQKTLDRGVPQLKLSAGFPWDCWYNLEYCQNNPSAALPHIYDIPWWFEDLTPAIDPEYLISNSPVPTGFYSLKYFYNDSYRVIDTEEYRSLLYMRAMKVFLLKRNPGTGHTETGLAAYRFIDNLRGADIFELEDGAETQPEVDLIEASLNGRAHPAIVQQARTAAGFRLQLPATRCRLTVDLAAAPTTWNKPGDGILCKILLGDNLFENLFDTVGMSGVAQRQDFFKPRNLFLGPRPLYLHYLDPKEKPGQRTWHSVSIDLTRFAGKVVDIVFVVLPGPNDDARYDTALWGNPVIETY